MEINAPNDIEIEAMHLAGQEELQFCMSAIAELTKDRTTIPVTSLIHLQNKLLDRWTDLQI